MPITNFNYHLRRFAFVRSFLVLFLFSLISTLFAENENYFDLKIVLLISKEIILFKKKSQCERGLFAQRWRKNKLREIWYLLFIVEARYPRIFQGIFQENPCFSRWSENYSLFEIIQIFRLNFPCLCVFLRSLRQLKFVISYRHVLRNQIFNVTLLEGVCASRSAKRDVSLIPCEIYNFTFVF